MEFTARQKSLAIIPHITASLSILGSLYIIVDVLRHRKKISSPQHRLLLGMSLSDLIASVFVFLSTWPVPKGDDDSIPYGAMGTVTTCNVQGFMIQLGVACPLYNAFLAIYYLMVVRYGFKDSQFINAELYCHFFCWTFAFTTAVASYFLDLYNSANIFCWIAPLPYECADSLRHGGVTTCIRGDNAWLYRLIFYYLWLWVAVIIVSVTMFLMFWTVYQQAKKVQRFDHSALKSSERTAQKHVHRVAVQGILYVAAFYLTAIPTSVVRMYQTRFDCTSTFYPLSLATVIFFPLQGMWNFIIYIRPNYISYLKRKRRSSSHPLGDFLERILAHSTSFFFPRNLLASSTAISQASNDEHSLQEDDPSIDHAVVTSQEELANDHKGLVCLDECIVTENSKKMQQFHNQVSLPKMYMIQETETLSLSNLEYNDFFENESVEEEEIFENERCRSFKEESKILIPRFDKGSFSRRRSC